MTLMKGPKECDDLWNLSMYVYKHSKVNMSSKTKKIKQDELRRLMNLEKKRLSECVKKIESPLARYDKDGTLNCIICQSIVRSEAVWSIHLNSKKHKENVANKIEKKGESLVSNSRQSLKRPITSSSTFVDNKKIKSILTNTSSISSSDSSVSCLDGKPPEHKNSSSRNENNNQNGSRNLSESSEEEAEDPVIKDVLPEGFFDDPKLDAKVRNVEYKDPIEEEWEQFQREIREETSKAQQIIADETEEATTERQIDEIDEQIRNWNRVVTLEKKKQEVIATPAASVQNVKEEESSEDENDFEEFLDWRSKKSF